MRETLRDALAKCEPFMWNAVQPGENKGNSHFASILVVETRDLRVELLCGGGRYVRNALKTREL